MPDLYLFSFPTVALHLTVTLEKGIFALERWGVAEGVPSAKASLSPSLPLPGLVLHLAGLAC